MHTKTKTLSALAAAALLAAPGLQANEVEFGGDFDLRAYAGDASETPGQTGGIDSRLRLSAAFITDTGLQAHARVAIGNKNWIGDATGTPHGAEGGDLAFTADNRGQEGVLVDYGFVRFPLAGGTVSTGRMEANWANDFTTSDARRDRLMYVRPITSAMTGLALIDRRADGELFGSDRGRDSFYLGAIHNTPVGTVGWLTGYWSDGGETLNDVYHFAPYIDGQMGAIRYSAAYELYVAGDEDKTALFPDTHHSGYLRLGTEIGTVLLEGQAAFVLDGGNVSPGFDTFSSLINNSPEHNASATNVAALNVGGLGAEVDRYLFAARASTNVTDRLRIKGAMGWIDYDGLGAVPGTEVDVDEDVIFYDLQAHYRVNRDITTWATLGYVDSKDLLGENHTAASLNLRTTF